jgi:23S rRNA (uracil1939-C5)-methyltransferase
LEPIELDVNDLSHDGRGVARLDGKAVFVTGALAGERVLARRQRRQRQFDEAELVEVLVRSPDRVDPPCRHFGTCGGCALQHLAGPAQIVAKQKTLLDNLERIGEVTPARVLPPLTGAHLGYRRRGRLSVKWVAKKGKVLVGFRETNGRYVADLESCPVAHPAVGTRIAALARLIEGLAARCEIAQIEFAVGDELAAFVFRNLVPLGEPDRAALVAFAREHGVAIYLQPGGVDSVVALEPADARLSFRIPAYDVAFEFRPLDFIQVNGDINARMIDHALAELAPGPGDRVLDLYCGLGNFTLPIARRAASVVGVEGDAGLVARARANAAANGIANAEFFADDLAADQRDAPWARRPYDLLLLDPARVGAEAVFGYLPGRDVRRVVYVSCHPGSLARDAGILVRKHGFRLAAAGVMDMFPHTAHVESIAVFERR